MNQIIIYLKMKFSLISYESDELLDQYFAPIKSVLGLNQDPL